MEIRIKEDSVEIEGYVNAVERLSKPLPSRTGEFVERICKGAFQRALQRNDNVRLLYNHNWSRDLGGTKDGNVELFEEYIGLYDESEGDGVIYLNSSAGYYATQNQSAAYFDEIAGILMGLDAGECALYKSSYGYHVLCRYVNESGAYDKEENKDIFGDFYTDLISRLFEKLCADRAGDVEIDVDVFEEAPTIKEVGINVKY